MALSTSSVLQRPATGRLIRGGLALTDASVPVSGEVQDYLAEQAPDAVVITPLVEPGSQQLEYLRAAKQRGIPSCLCVASWDNLTTKGLIHEVPDVVTVWNEEQKQEAIELHGVPAERVTVTGAAAYDHWFSWQPSTTRDEFCAKVGLDPARPFILYLGSSGFIAPDEAAFLADWISELRDRDFAELQVLARPHPTNPLIGGRPSQLALAAIEDLHLYPPAGANPTDAESRSDYFDSVYWCSAAAGVNTSAFLESALLGRPVHTILSERYADTQKGTLHFHRLLSAGGGLLDVAADFDEHAAKLREALAQPHPEGCVSERSRQVHGDLRPAIRAL